MAALAQPVSSVSQYEVSARVGMRFALFAALSFAKTHQATKRSKPHSVKYDMHRHFFIAMLKHAMPAAFPGNIEADPYWDKTGLYHVRLVTWEHVAQFCAFQNCVTNNRAWANCHWSMDRLSFLAVVPPVDIRHTWYPLTHQHSMRVTLPVVAMDVSGVVPSPFFPTPLPDSIQSRLWTAPQEAWGNGFVFLLAGRPAHTRKREGRLIYEYTMYSAGAKTPGDDWDAWE